MYTDTEPGSVEPLGWLARTNPAAADSGVSAGACVSAGTQKRTVQYKRCG